MGPPASTEIDVAAVRADTPGVESVVHLDSAGASLPPRSVVETQIRYLREEAETGGYETSRRHADDIAAVYDSIARMIGADPGEIAVTSNATESWQLAFHSIPLGPGDRILTGEAAYASNFIGFLQAVRRHGASVEVVPSGHDGRTDVEALEAMVDDRVKLIALTHVPTNGGLVNPAAEIGAVARRHGIPYLLDECQAVGQMDVDVRTLGCDFLTATGRKFLRGPRGTGLLYARRSILDRTEPPFLDLRGADWPESDVYVVRADARRYENWEFNYAAVLGLGRAVDYALALGMAAIETRVRSLAAGLRDRLATVPGVELHDLGPEPCAIVTFSHPDVEAAEIEAGLVDRRINVTITTPGSTRIDATRRRLPDMVRAAPHYFNTETECELLVDAVREMVSAGP
jgi:cysteine desulfurase/selenocysteine lyase